VSRKPETKNCRSRRLDAVVAERTGLSRAQARGLILAGRVHVDGSPHQKPGSSVRPTANVIVEEPPRYVSRGGEKLEAALAAFAVDVRGALALDVGASTGGFTDALLAHGASHVVALDVGYGQIAWKLRNDPRVEVIERTNVRLLPLDSFTDPFDLIVVDTSFISLRSVLPRVLPLLHPQGAIVALVKPQFEVGRENVGRGVVHEPALHRTVLRELRDALAGEGARAVGVTYSPLRGPAGNIEFFFLLRAQGALVEDAELDRAVAVAHERKQHVV
jgi:23S rRNA (cytidine1920-2'-O)/16S rRNA (cytidine1409-2'-O)-methyltransferase